MRKLTLLLVAIAATVALSATAAFAYTLNPDGTGFVGKGEVQTAFGWNNNQLQQRAGTVGFEAVTVTERSWVCTNANNEMVQERERTTTTTGVLNSIARERNQITGFNLLGFTSSSSTTEGPPLNTCPSGPWSLTQEAGDPVLISSELYATTTFGGGQRVLLP
jgi:hypothetical protein